MSAVSKDSTRCRSLMKQTASALLVAAIFSACARDPLTFGNELLAKGDLKGAVIEFKQAVQDAPQSLSARLALANALERTFDTLGAEQQLRKAVDHGGDAETLVPRIALLMLDRGDHAKIINEFAKRSLQTPAGNSNLKAILSMAEAGLDHPKQAATLLASATTETGLTGLARGQMLAQQGKLKEALEQLDQAVSNSSKDNSISWWLFRALHRTYAGTGEHDKALEAIRSAHELAPWHIGISGEYGDALVGANKFEEAAKIRDQLKAQAPGHYWTNYLDAVILAEKGNVESSHAAGLKVLSIAPTHLRSNLIVASAELQNNNASMAEERLRKLLHEHPRNLQLLQMLATAQLRTQKFDIAAENIARGLSLVPNDRRLLMLSADLAILKKDIPEARKVLRNLLTQAPQDGQTIMRLAELSFMEKKPAEAQILLEEARPLVQDDPNLRDRLIALSLSSGNIELAQKLSDHAIKTRPSDPSSFLTAAAMSQYRKDIDGARQAALKALDLKPEYQPALNALTSLSRRPEEQAELIRRYELAIDTKSATPETYLAYVQLIRRSQTNEGKVIGALEKGLSVDPVSTPIRAMLIEELIRAGKTEEALSVAQFGASITNAPAELSGLLASTLERLGKSEQAMEVYRKLSTSYPQRSDWRLKLAELSLRNGRPQEARSVLHALMTDAPFEPAPFIALAKMTARENLDEAISIARQLGEKKENKLRSMLLEGDLLALSGKPNEALIQFSKSAKAGAMPEAAISAAQLLDAMEKKSAADQELSGALRKHPNDAHLLSYAGQRYLRHAQSDKAIEYLQRAVLVEPRNANFLNDLAWAQLQTNHPDALKNARAAIELKPNDPAILDTQGMALYKAGQNAAAISSLRDATKLLPEDPSPKLHLAEVLISSGKKQDAKELLKTISDKQLRPKDRETLARLNSDSKQ